MIARLGNKRGVLPLFFINTATQFSFESEYVDYHYA